MSQQRKLSKTYTEGDIQLAIQDIDSEQIQSVKRAAAIYKVPQTSVRYQRNRKRPRRNCELNSKRITKLEEKAIKEGILKYSARSLPVTRADVRDIADRLLRERNSRPVSKN
jgi:membrane-bound lytic murein transglycosylase MltF